MSTPHARPNKGDNNAQSSVIEDYESVLASYHRCEDSGELFDTFYDLFFAKSPRIRERFAETDMDKQKQIVMASLLWVLRVHQGDPIARREVEQLAESHSRPQLDVDPGLYRLWLDALCESIAKHDSQFTAELESKWRRVMQTGIDLMQSKY